MKANQQTSKALSRKEKTEKSGDLTAKNRENHSGTNRFSCFLQPCRFSII